MITERDLQEAIAECEGQKNPNANTCIKLAAFYTIREYMFPKPNENISIPSRSFSPAEEVHMVSYTGDSEFAQMVDGMPEDIAWEIMDDLMSTLSVLNPKLYNSIMRKMAE